jgi:tellurite resistance protein TerC
MDVAFIIIILQLIFLECILSIDNATVMGAMVIHLPTDQTTPWPHRLRRSLGWADRLLGSQRDAALKVGLFGAYAGRVLMLMLASMLVQALWVQALGALYLLYLGINYFGDRYSHQRESIDDKRLPRQQRGFWSVVLALNLADMAFSIDNVVAAIALSRELWVVILGVGIGIVAIRFAATIFARLIGWEPELESGAYLILLFISGRLLLELYLGIHIDDFIQFALSLSILVLTIIFARVKALRPLHIIFRPFARLFALINDALSFVFRILAAPFRRGHHEIGEAPHWPAAVHVTSKDAAEEQR